MDETISNTERRYLCVEIGSTQESTAPLPCAAETARKRDERNPKHQPQKRVTDLGTGFGTREMMERVLATRPHQQAPENTKPAFSNEDVQNTRPTPTASASPIDASFWATARPSPRSKTPK